MPYKVVRLMAFSETLSTVLRRSVNCTAVYSLFSLDNLDGLDSIFSAS